MTQQEPRKPRHHRADELPTQTPASSAPDRLARASSPPPIPGPAVRASVDVVGRLRTYEFLLDEHGQPTEVGAGRYAKVYLGVERWVESKTDHLRRVAIKVLQKNVPAEHQLRFQLEKSILERVQGHANVIELLASGENEAIGFIPESLRGRVENDFIVLELLDLTLEERLKGSRNRADFDDLLALTMPERVFRVLDYVVPIAAAVEFAHLERDICHRDIKPANVLLQLPNPKLAASRLVAKLTDFNAGKAADDVDMMMTRLQPVPGTLFFQSPEQETNAIELLVVVQHGVAEVEYFEDFYSDIYRNDTFVLFNRLEHYGIVATDRARKRLLLDRPYAERSETNVRAKIVKAVGRPADIYSLGALLYYLISGAYANPKSLYDAFRQFLEYSREENNTISSYVEYEYGMVRSLRAPKQEGFERELSPSDRFFSYKHYLDGNGEVIDLEVMRIIARAMIRTKPDSYCHVSDLRTEGVSAMVRDLNNLYLGYGLDPRARHAFEAGVHRQRSKGFWSRLFGSRGSRWS